MQTRFITALTTTLNPFSKTSRTPRLFLAQLPPSIRGSIKVKVNQLPRESKAPSTLALTFKDGKEMKFVFDEAKAGEKREEVKLQDVLNEVERHSRGLARKEDLTS